MQNNSNERKKNENSLFFRGKKVTQFHVDFVKKYLDKILTGEINITEMLKMLKIECISKNKTIIKDHGSINRIIIKLLQDRPNELEEYKKILKTNIGKRSLGIGRFNDIELGQYNSEEVKFKQMIINEYLPKILSSEMTIVMIEKELSISHKTINKIIKEYYLQQNDYEGLEKYQEIKKKNSGLTMERRNDAKKMRKDVEGYNVVSNTEFILLSEKEQKKQLIMKIRKARLKEEITRKEKSLLTTEETTIKEIERTMKYFQGKNDIENNKIYFSDEDIRYMIFRYPTIINRRIENLEEKVNTLKSYEDIDVETAYGMIKAFPAIMGYDAKRTKGQLDLLESENLMDYIICTPSGLMRSENLMYALIQYAKERHHTLDLTNINRNNIFMGNNTLKRFYKTSYDEIKARFPYGNKKENDKECSISAEEIGKATYKARAKSNEASKVLSNAIEEQEKGLE